MAEKESESGLNYVIGIDAKILETQVTGLIKGGNGKTEVLILQKKVETVLTLDLKTLLEEVTKQFSVPADDILAAMKGIEGIFPSFDPKKLTFQLDQIFFYHKEPKETDDEPEVATEYAFSIKINLGGILELAGIISIDTLYLSIWNTKRENVLKQFNMVDISVLLSE